MLSSLPIFILIISDFIPSGICLPLYSSTNLRSLTWNLIASLICAKVVSSVTRSDRSCSTRGYVGRCSNLLSLDGLTAILSRFIWKIAALALFIPAALRVCTDASPIAPTTSLPIMMFKYTLESAHVGLTTPSLKVSSSQWQYPEIPSITPLTWKNRGSGSLPTIAPPIRFLCTGSVSSSHDS